MVVVAGTVVVGGGGMMPKVVVVVVGGGAAVVVVAGAPVVVVVGDDFFDVVVVVDRWVVDVVLRAAVVEVLVELDAVVLVVLVVDVVLVVLDVLELVVVEVEWLWWLASEGDLGLPPPEWIRYTATPTTIKAATMPSTSGRRPRPAAPLPEVKRNSSWMARPAGSSAPGGPVHVPSSSMCRARPSCPSRARSGPSVPGHNYTVPRLRSLGWERRSMTNIATPLGAGGEKADRGKGRPRRTEKVPCQRMAPGAAP